VRVEPVLCGLLLGFLDDAELRAVGPVVERGLRIAAAGDVGELQLGDAGLEHMAEDVAEGGSPGAVGFAVLALEQAGDEDRRVAARAWILEFGCDPVMEQLVFALVGYKPADVVEVHGGLASDLGVRDAAVGVEVRHALDVDDDVAGWLVDSAAGLTAPG
jgi:hypothetical protein